MSGSNLGISITSLNPDAYFRLGRIDSAYQSSGGFWMTDKVAKQLFYGDTINSSNANWDSTTLHLIVNAGLYPNNISFSDWANTNNEYIGIKYQNTTDTIYGWIRLDCLSNGCYVKDYSFGAATSSVKDIELPITRIYPNPTTAKIYIERTNNNPMEVNLYNVIGKQVSPTVKTENQTTEIDVSSLNEGIYFVKLRTNEGMLTKKIVIAR